MSVAAVERVVPDGAPPMAMPNGLMPPMSRPPNPAPIAGEPGRSLKAWRTWSGVRLSA